MPKNKRPNRKPGVKKTGARATVDRAQTESDGGDPNVKSAKSTVKTYGSPKSSRSPLSPGMNRSSARSR